MNFLHHIKIFIKKFIKKFIKIYNSLKNKMDKINLYYNLLEITEDNIDFMIFRDENIKPKAIFSDEEIKLYYDPYRKSYKLNSYSTISGGNTKIIVY